MRIAVDSPSLADAGLSLERGNQSAAIFYQALAGRLSRCGAMAGDTAIAEHFARSYDEAAQTYLATLADLVEAFGVCARLTSLCRRNHARAEERSLLSGRRLPEAGQEPRELVSVDPVALPSALGGSDSLPGWAAWLLDQVEGFVWPDADVDRLRAAAQAWRAVSSQVSNLARTCGTAIDALLITSSFEVPLAVEKIERLGLQCDGVSAQALVLARACEDYADQVEEHRAAILDLVHDLLRDAVVIQGIGMFLGAFSAGITAGGAAAINSAKIAAAAPRLVKILETLRALASACGVSMRVAAVRLGDLRAELAVFQRARMHLAMAFEAPHVVRVERVRGIVRHTDLVGPDDLRGLSRGEMAQILKGWETRPSSTGSGIVYLKPGHTGQQIRVMDGYQPGSRPDPLTWGPYVTGTYKGVRYKVPLEGNPTL